MRRNLNCKNSLVVAEDVLAAERGGQWLFSCFGPFKEQPSIPGMEDLSPEEVRWEMYQAEKKGTVDQVVSFLCFETNQYFNFRFPVYVYGL